MMRGECRNRSLHTDPMGRLCRVVCAHQVFLSLQESLYVRRDLVAGQGRIPVSDCAARIRLPPPARGRKKGLHGVGEFLRDGRVRRMVGGHDGGVRSIVRAVGVERREGKGREIGETFLK
jgi:hypothetical protein